MSGLVERVWVYTKPGHIPRVHTQAQKEEAAANGWLETEYIPAARIAALEAEVGRKDAHIKSLIQLALDGGLTDDLLAQVFPDAKKKNGQPADDFAKRARRVVNEARAALEPKP